MEVEDTYIVIEVVEVEEDTYIVIEVVEVEDTNTVTLS